MKHRHLFLGFIGCLLSTAVFAASVPSYGNEVLPWVVTPSVSYYYFQSKRYLNNTAVPGLAIGYRFTPQWEAEIYGGYLRTKERGKRTRKRRVTGFLALADGLYHFRAEKAFQPYLVAGLGAIRLTPDQSDDPKIDANVNVGGGIFYFFDPQVALRLDARYLYTIEGNNSDLMGTLGIAIYPFRK